MLAAPTSAAAARRPRPSLRHPSPAPPVTSALRLRRRLATCLPTQPSAQHRCFVAETSVPHGHVSLSSLDYRPAPYATATLETSEISPWNAYGGHWIGGLPMSRWKAAPRVRTESVLSMTLTKSSHGSTTWSSSYWELPCSGPGKDSHSMYMKSLLIFFQEHVPCRRTLLLSPL